VSKDEKRIVIYGKRRVFDGFFKIDEAELSYERFDGKMGPPVKRLCFERGDSVAAILFDAERRKLLLVKQFRYPTYEKGPGWIVETVAGMLAPGETPEAGAKRWKKPVTKSRYSSLSRPSTFPREGHPSGSDSTTLRYSRRGRLGRGAELREKMRI
jgi:hypothetical protein